jgi:uncharacterized protein YecT (DUF1311 family)
VRRRLAVLLALALPLGASGASFDCARAASATEHLICADVQVSDLDNDLADAYARALRGPAGAAVRHAQQEWIGRVRAACKDAACLRQAYVERIAALTARAVAAADVCTAVTGYANAGVLEALELRPTEPPAALRALLARSESLGSEPDDYWSADLDGDGASDAIARATAGTMRESSVAVVPGRAGARPVVFDGPGLDVEPLAIRGHTYLLTGDGKRLAGLYSFDGAGFRQVCAFRVRKDVRADLAHGRSEPVCQAALAGQLEPLPFPLAHRLVRLPVEERFNALAPTPGAALADIDGDGRPELVARFAYEFGGGRGCEATVLGVLDPAGAAVPDSPLNRVLLTDLGGFPCRPTLELVRFHGALYIDARRAQGERSLYRVGHDHAEQVCRIHRTPVHVALKTGPER